MTCILTSRGKFGQSHTQREDGQGKKEAKPGAILS